MNDELPSTVRYVKNGAGGSWWKSAKQNGEVHAGWKIIPTELLQKPNYAAIEALVREHFVDQGAATRDYKALRHLLEAPSRHIWITFEEGSMWWCTVGDKVHTNQNKNDKDRRNFWLVCKRPWSKISFSGKALAVAELPGVVTSVAGFRATVCVPRAQKEIIRTIRGELHPDVVTAATKRHDFEEAVKATIKLLRPLDFEELIELILERTGWIRISKLGGQQEGFDLEAQNVAADEIAFVQVKSSASQVTLDDYVQRYNDRRDRYARMIFAVHSSDHELNAPDDFSIQVWMIDRLAELVVRLGLAEWIERKVA